MASNFITGGDQLNDKPLPIFAEAAEQAQEIMYILPENRKTFSIFCDLLTQLRFNSLGYIMGFDYSSVFNYLNNMVKKKYIRRIFNDLQVCEQILMHSYNSRLKEQLQNDKQ